MEKKRLQSNFTTPEQAKRLLELGVPEDSADCYYHHYFTNDPTPLLRVLQLQWNETIGSIRGKSGQKIEPCWSVGRLMEIFDICFPESNTACWPPYYELDTDYITYVVHLYERGIMELDFSKLED